MKKLFAILMSIMMIACFMPTMAFAETPTASVSGDPITFEVGKDINGTATITVTGDNTFQETLTANESNVWVTNLPEGVSYTVAKDTENTKAKITFKGTSNTPATKELSFKIPAGQLTGESTPEQEVTGNITLKITGYTVKVTAGAGMAQTSGNNVNTEQPDLGGSVAMQELSFTASEGYYFPDPYTSAKTENGITVEMVAYDFLAQLRGGSCRCNSIMS